ncbi:Resolvase, N terminal domain [Actinacidiphila guanduensis]|uniref:Resolvase, N terminal domain n=1 Tax=Actinacidiphila guanduensis TaxID=310781 RepID=A0A1G9YB67_9ACTN|nr:Resolvase, N terminal domain [Actinacidiphila guanduensis]
MTNTSARRGRGEAPRTVAVHIYDRHTTPDRDALRHRLEACSAFARRQGWEIVGWYVDSGTDAFTYDRRPALDRLLHSMSQGTDDRRLLIYDWSRLSNDLAVQAEYLRRVRGSGGTTNTVISGDNNSSTQRGRLRSLARVA